jgi:hypothetical protein
MPSDPTLDAKGEAPYPDKPYTYSHMATYPSGFKGKLVTYGAKCQQCKSRKTFLDGGRPACADHLDRLCKHGLAGCYTCGPVKDGLVSVRKIR